jgi:FAD synthase
VYIVSPYGEQKQGYLPGSITEKSEVYYEPAYQAMIEVDMNPNVDVISDVMTAKKYLGYNYFLEGTVVGGYQVGRKIGFPTANLRVDFPNKLIPSIGVYAVRVHVAGQQWKGMLSIGYRPTLNNGNDLSIEVHILDFEGDIYNQKMRLEFI